MIDLCALASDRYHIELRPGGQPSIICGDEDEPAELIVFGAELAYRASKPSPLTEALAGLGFVRVVSPGSTPFIATFPVSRLDMVARLVHALPATRCERRRRPSTFLQG